MEPKYGPTGPRGPLGPSISTRPRSPALLQAMEEMENNYVLRRLFWSVKTAEELMVKLTALKLQGFSPTPKQQTAIERQLASLKLSPGNRAVEKP